MNAPIQSTFSLADKYLVENGAIYLTGMQALVRLMLDQKRLDARAGLSTAGFVCGYPGSPVGGVDGEMERNAALLQKNDIVHKQGLNEELAATAAFGTQILHTVPGARYDGVFALWFGKAPGVDRTGDAFHHANFRGVGRNGGVLAVAGDDPHARSTIFPSDSNLAFYKAFMPILAPGDIQDMLDLGLHGYALSRACGLWVGYKLVTDVADSAATAHVAPDRIQPIIPTVEFEGRPFTPTLRPNEAGGALIEAERKMLHAQLEIARQYARLNRLNRIVVNPASARIGLMTGGKTYFDLRQALADLGLDESDLETAGVRILKMGMLYPVEPEIVRDFAEGLDEIFVIEDKRPFLEMFAKEMFYGRPGAPRIVGKRDETGADLLPAHGELSADVIARALAARLAKVVSKGTVGARIAELEAPAPRAVALSAPRMPYFCSGCPHNRALRVPEGSVVGAGIGCHIMTIWMAPVFGESVGFTQMGGEGAQWAGLAPFTDTKHFFQNLGDGTFHHSGSLGLRFAGASGANVTYKILYNSTVAMTGGQNVQGAMSVPQMVKMLEAEGAKKIIITTDEPGKYGPAVHSARVMHRDDLLEAERELAGTQGLTVLINDQECATQKRRLRRRGKMDYKPQSTFINERVCEGCGDCGRKSNCLSVQPVETEFGSKTRIHQSSCNQDFSCMLGDCPSFVTVAGEARTQTPARRAAQPFPADVVLPEPALDARDHFSMCLFGIGGTGVVTVNQVLGTAAFLAGMHVQTYDHTGSSQKAGPVVSHFKAGPKGHERAPTLSTGEADLLLVFDPLVALSPVNMKLASPGRTLAVVSTAKTPTGAMVADRSRRYPSFEAVKAGIDSVTRAADNTYFNAQELAEALTGDHLASNMLLVGAAWQKGAIPVPADKIEAAIRLNGTQVDMNIAAFRWGRLMVAAPERMPDIASVRERPATATPLAPAIAEMAAPFGPTRAIVARRLEELIAYQNETYARAYLADVLRARQADIAATGAEGAFTRAVAENLFKLMAYKDEYEVARLLLIDSERARLAAAFGPDARVKWHLHPTFLRRMGFDRKVAFGPWFAPVLKTLRALKRLRGTAFDPFGRAQLRRIERQLIGDYRSIVARAAGKLGTHYATAVQLAEAPDAVRGYEDVKLKNVATFRAETARLLAALDAPPQRRAAA